MIMEILGPWSEDFLFILLEKFSDADVYEKNSKHKFKNFRCDF